MPPMTASEASRYMLRAMWNSAKRSYEDYPEYEDNALDWSPKSIVASILCPICCHDVPSKCADPKWCDFNIDEADVGVR
jgi:hypothetical protein